MNTFQGYGVVSVKMDGGAKLFRLEDCFSGPILLGMLAETAARARQAAEFASQMAELAKTVGVKIEPLPSWEMRKTHSLPHKFAEVLTLDFDHFLAELTYGAQRGKAARSVLERDGWQVEVIDPIEPNTSLLTV